MLDTYAHAEEILLIIFAGINMTSIIIENELYKKIDLLTYGFMRKRQISKEQATVLVFDYLKKEGIISHVRNKNKKNTESNL